MLLSVWWLASSARAACPAGTTVLGDDVRAAEVAFGALDLPAFDAARAAMHVDLGCLSESPPAGLIARVHGVDAIAALAAKDDAATVLALQSAHAADDTFALPLEVPAGHRLRTMLAELSPSSVRREPVIAPTGTVTVLDGRATELRPTERPVVMLLLEESGRVPWSAWLAPGAPVPDLSQYAVAVADPEPQPHAPGRLRPPLVAATAIGAVATGVMYGLGLGAAARFDDPSTPYPELDGLRGRANGLGGGALVGLVATVGFGTATVLARETP